MKDQLNNNQQVRSHLNKLKCELQSKIAVEENKYKKYLPEYQKLKNEYEKNKDDSDIKNKICDIEVFIILFSKNYIKLKK